ncbi:hypothetical protein L202_02912 [Cryptococcus amylolentus CBS 6039]|uniref:Protein kinase domain-containing protein n=1 Tax=Cryptococcus amylolentus CBS 6039 TaxID=1295533 RepID=A0A1E3HWT5_9TREE|nr:hypothetical protein L202_02912 [Cryptococcus amylolentus CBS 6039]ODN80757.1 hypothetical protein L202_02912 [Cryptococcus amylolentus CBS 6039]
MKARAPSVKLGVFFSGGEAEDGELPDETPRKVSTSSSRKTEMWLPPPHEGIEGNEGVEGSAGRRSPYSSPPGRGGNGARHPPRSPPREHPYREASTVKALPNEVYSTAGGPSSRKAPPPPSTHNLPAKPSTIVTDRLPASISPEKQAPRHSSNGIPRRPSTSLSESGRNHDLPPAPATYGEPHRRPHSPPLPPRLESKAEPSGPPLREWDQGKVDHGHSRGPEDWDRPRYPNRSERDGWGDGRNDRRERDRESDGRAPYNRDYRDDRGYRRHDPRDYDRNWHQSRRRTRSPDYHGPPDSHPHRRQPYRPLSRSRSPPEKHVSNYSMVPSSNYDVPPPYGAEESKYSKDEAPEKDESASKFRPITLKREKVRRSDDTRAASTASHTAESARPPTPDAPPPPPLSPPPATPPAPPTVPHAPLLHQDKTRPPSPEREEGEYVEPPRDKNHKEKGRDRRRDHEPERFGMRTVKEEEEAYGRVFVGSSTLMGYETGRKLGEGTFGVVTQATERSTGREVALKKITTHNTRDGAHITTLREIKILKSLNHPNVVPLIDMVMSRGNPQNRKVNTEMFMVFPYMDHDLCGLLGNPDFQKRPSVHKSLMKQLLEGMAFIHANNIIHRDIKTANILVNKHYQVMIADFGLARPWTKEADMPPHLAREYTNMVVTRWYRAPELLLGATRYTPAVDLWSIGCVLGELYMKRPLLPGGGDREQLAMIVAKCGPLSQETWPGWRSLPGFVDAPGHDWERTPRERHIAEDVTAYGLDRAGANLLGKLLTLNPSQRPTASEALDHPWFWIEPLPINPKTEAPLRLESSHEMSAWHHKQPAAPAQPPPQPVMPPRVGFSHAPQANPYANNPYAAPPLAPVQQSLNNYPHQSQHQPAPNPYQPLTGHVPNQSQPGHNAYRPRPAYAQQQAQQGYSQAQPSIQPLATGYGAGPPVSSNLSGAAHAAMGYGNGGGYGGGQSGGYDGAVQGGYGQPSLAPPPPNSFPAPPPSGMRAPPGSLPKRPTGPPPGFSLAGGGGGAPRNRPPQNQNFGNGGGGNARNGGSYGYQAQPGHMKREHSDEQFNANKRHKPDMTTGGGGGGLPY